MKLHFTTNDDPPDGGAHRVHIPKEVPRGARVHAAAEALREVGIQRVTGVSLAKPDLLGVAMDAWVAAGGSAEDGLWGDVVVSELKGRVREHLLRIDSPCFPGPLHGRLAGFGAAVELLGEGAGSGVSLLGLLRGAKGLLSGLEGPVHPPGEVRGDGEPLLASAQTVVVSSRGIPPVIARWLGSDNPDRGEVRYWATSAHSGALQRILDQDARVSGVLDGSLHLATVERFVLDGEVMEGDGLPVLIRSGPWATLRPA